MNAAEIFVRKVKYKEEGKLGCWNVESGKDNGDGYIYITYRNKESRKSKRIGAHRLSYMAFNGDIPKGKSIMHSCDNRSCVNPDHLSIGTRKQNTQDMVNKGRSNRWEERGGKRQKLTSEQIKLIKQSELSSYQLSEIYPVSAVQIRRIRNGSRCSSVA